MIEVFLTYADYQFIPHPSRVRVSKLKTEDARKKLPSPRKMTENK